MAGDADDFLLPLEGLASGNGKALTYGMSGAANHLTALQATGSVYAHSSLHATTPMQKLVFTMNRVGAVFTGAMTAPMATMNGRGGDTAELTTPMQVLAATGTVPIIASAALTAPMQVLAGHMIVGSMWSVALRTPMQLASTRTGWNVVLATPMQRMAAHITAMEYARANLVAPAPRITGTMSVYSYPWSAAMRTPMIVAGPYGIARLTTPMQKIAAMFLIPATFEAWLMNVRNNGVTRWTNFPFLQVVQAGGDTYAVGNDGNLYLMGGDLDASVAAPLTPIQWQFETGLSDLDSPGVKHIPYLYLDGIIDGEIQIVLLDDRGREFAYEYDTKDRGAVHMTHRRKLGNGIRTRNVGFRILSTTGAYIELDSLEPEATVTQRSI